MEVAEYRRTLPANERHLAGRLEGFGDIVFGFAVSQCALDLPLRGGHADLASPFALLLYFATFALLASLWLSYHRMMAGAFRPAGIDLFLAFAYLAFVSLMPFAQYAIAHDSATVATARAAVAEYSALYATMTALASIAVVRNLRRAAGSPASERDRTWAAFVRQVTLCTTMVLMLGTDLTFGPSSTIVFAVVIPVAVRIARLRFAHAPVRGWFGADPRAISRAAH